jgi:hypothetical protein
MEIPVAGKVCPFCQNDKTGDREKVARWQDEKQEARRGALVLALVGLVCLLLLVGLAYLLGW